MMQYVKAIVKCRAHHRMLFGHASTNDETRKSHTIADRIENKIKVIDNFTVINGK